METISTTEGLAGRLDQAIEIARRMRHRRVVYIMTEEEAGHVRDLLRTRADINEVVSRISIAAKAASAVHTGSGNLGVIEQICDEYIIPNKEATMTQGQLDINKLLIKIHNSIDKQLPEEEREMAHGIATVVVGIAQDIKRIADAIEEKKS